MNPGDFALVKALERGVITTVGREELLIFVQFLDERALNLLDGGRKRDSGILLARCHRSRGLVPIAEDQRLMSGQAGLDNPVDLNDAVCLGVRVTGEGFSAVATEQAIDGISDIADPAYGLGLAGQDETRASKPRFSIVRAKVP